MRCEKESKAEEVKGTCNHAESIKIKMKILTVPNSVDGLGANQWEETRAPVLSPTAATAYTAGIAYHRSEQFPSEQHPSGVWAAGRGGYEQLHTATQKLGGGDWGKI